MCKKYPGLEWSGILFYTEEGSISEPDSYEVHVNYLYPMNIGSSGFTTIENYEEVQDAIENYPELDNMKQGFIHSHNSMDTFFSGTDVQQLIDGAEQYDYFLSVITNNDAEHIARISFEINADITIGINKASYQIGNKVGYFSCKIEKKEEEIDTFILARIKEIDSQRTVSNYKGYNHNYLGVANTYNPTNYYSNNWYNENSFVEADDFLPEELLTMYATNLADYDTAEEQDIKDLIEDAYDISFKQDLNEKQQASKLRCTHELISKSLRKEGYYPTLKDFTKENLVEYYSGVVRNNKPYYTKNSTYAEQIQNIIDVSRIYDDYTPLVAMSAALDALAVVRKIREKHEREGSSFVMYIYLSILAHIATRSKEYKITDLMLLPQAEYLNLLLSQKVIDLYSEWLPNLNLEDQYQYQY